MFELDGRQNWVEAQPAEVVYLATSINRPAVAPPDRSPETAQAYICTLNQAEGDFVYIYLHLISSNTGLLYRWSEGAVSAETVESLRLNAREFTESMGFMMDDLRFLEMPPDQQAETFARTPLFHQDIAFLKSEDETVTELEIVEPDDGSGGEVVIEAVEDDAAAVETVEESEAPAAPTESEVEEITLDVMGSDEIAPGIAEPAADPSAAGPAEEEIALGGTLAEPVRNEEDILLDQLEVKPEPEPPPPPFPDPAPEPAAEAESAAAVEAVAEAEAMETEISVEAEESSALLDALEAQAEEAPPLPASATEARPAPAETGAIEEETIEVPAPPFRSAAVPRANFSVAGAEGGATADEYAFLVSLLAMM